MLISGFNRLTYFSLHRLIGSNIRKYYREFLSLETQGAEQVHAVQTARLEKLLHYAARNVPFYKRHVSESTSLTLNDFPILTKTAIRDSFHDLMAPEILEEYKRGKPSRFYSWIAVQTGGSTGMPTTVIHDRDFRDSGRAGRLFNQVLCGFPLGVPYIRLWGSMRDINNSKGSLTQRTASRLARETMLNAFRMEDAQIESYIDVINRSSVKHIMAYADAAYRMAQYILVHKRKIRPIESVMACAGTVTQHMKDTIALAFGSPRVHNIYASRDCGPMACECRAGSLHIYDNQVLLEVVDEKGHQLPAGDAGRILVTLLRNYGFPIIRYEIGDVGARSAARCSCGIQTGILDRVEGRTVEFLLSRTGGYISPAYFIHLIGVVHNPGVIQRFQIVQHAENDVELQVEPDASASQSLLHESLAKIRRDLLAVFGEPLNLRIQLVDAIAPSSSGKFLSSINAIRKSAAR